MIDHMDIESTCIHKDSEEAQQQLQMDPNATGLIIGVINILVVKFGYQIFYFPLKNTMFSSFVIILYFRTKSSGTETS